MKKMPTIVFLWGLTLASMAIATEKDDSGLQLLLLLCITSLAHLGCLDLTIPPNGHFHVG
jgi:hypothetical protein